MEKFLDVYNKITKDNLGLLGSIYTDDIHFTDPAHEIIGLDKLTLYFAHLYENTNSVHFQFSHHLRKESDGYVQWEMSFSHPRLNKGQAICVPGSSYLRFTTEEKVIFHRDYFDLGGMLYEQLPLLGRLITVIKRRLGS